MPFILFKFHPGRLEKVIWFYESDGNSPTGTTSYLRKYSLLTDSPGPTAVHALFYAFSGGDGTPSLSPNSYTPV